MPATMKNCIWRAKKLSLPEAFAAAGAGVFFAAGWFFAVAFSLTLLGMLGFFAIPDQC